jgi:hypothetical protein
MMMMMMMMMIIGNVDHDDDIPGGHARVHLHLRPALCHLRHRHRRQGRWATFFRKSMIMMMMTIFHDTNDCIDAKGGGDNFSVTMRIMIIEIMVIIFHYMNDCINAKGGGRQLLRSPLASATLAAIMSCHEIECVRHLHRPRLTPNIA